MKFLIRSSIRLKWEHLFDVRHEFIRRIVNEEFVTIEKEDLNFTQLKQIYRYDLPDGHVKVLGQHGKLFMFNGRAVLLLEDERLFSAQVKHYYS
jgi:hypothetical protein